MPKPRSKNMYCNVCRESYIDYLEVILGLLSILKAQDIEYALETVLLTVISWNLRVGLSPKIRRMESVVHHKLTAMTSKLK